MAGIVNSMLIKWTGGWRTLSRSSSIAVHGRKEGFLRLGNVTEVSEVDRIVTALFNRLAGPVVSTTATIEPSGTGDEPYIDFAVADSITAPDETGVPTSYRVRAMTVTEDNEGNPIFVPELRDVLEERDDAVQRWLARMTDGALGGRTASASPTPEQLPEPHGPPMLELPPFSLAGTVIVSESGRYYPPSLLRLVRLQAALGVAGTTSTTVVVKRNGTVVATLVVPAGSTQAHMELSIAVPTSSYLTMGVTVAGTGARNLVMTTLISMS